MSFREVMWNKRRNEHRKLKYTERYQNYPEPRETIYKDVTDTAVSGLTERVGKSTIDTAKGDVGRDDIDAR